MSGKNDDRLSAASVFDWGSPQLLRRSFFDELLLPVLSCGSVSLAVVEGLNRIFFIKKIYLKIYVFTACPRRWHAVPIWDVGTYDYYSTSVSADCVQRHCLRCCCGG
jgi:hypothetical protein